MAIAERTERVIEVLDSEDEPFTSSPEAPLNSAVSQLDGTVGEPPQDAPARAGSSVNRTEDSHAYKVAEHDEQPVALSDTQSNENIARTNPQCDALQENTTDLNLPHQHGPSLTDTCGSSNWHSSVPTDLSSLQISKSPEPASGGNVKGPITETEESNFHPTVETSNATSDASYANQHTLAADTQLLNDDEPSVLSSMKNTVESASLEAAHTVSTLEGGLPTIKLAEHGEAGLLHLEGEPLLQDHQAERSQSSPRAGENAQRDSTDPYDVDFRGCSLPPSLTPGDISSSANERLLKRSTTTERAFPITRRVPYKDSEHTEMPQMPRSAKEEENIQPIISPTKDPSIFIRNVTMEHPDPDVSMDVVQLPLKRKQQQVGSIGEDNEVTADLAPALDSTIQSAHQLDAKVSEAPNNTHLNASLSTVDAPLEEASAILHELSETQDVAETQLRDRKGNESMGVGRRPDPSMVAETSRAESIPGYSLDSITQTSSFAASITEDTQPIIAKSAQEITLEELRAKRAALISSLAALPVIRDLIASTESLHTSSQSSNSEPTDSDVMAAAHKINKKHIKLLHEYNEMKDVGQGLMGLIADQRGVRIVEVQDDFGVDAKD
ncbi:uncharacterized protein N0V89_005822 [Didymosphaeria variabile]|uniref:Swi5-domain-containing protein n=1 Tax=Didymosphaeria variabile TaxID=1932322 RepID=A0A9W8XME4_9PLEO|nr:uncharacterized protein N0V89_005822 [Didymosphaeria variabile]KAJ4354089.1 hypothetical protein N0V89_005822 [Didymosphaeria variabile]